MTRLISIFGGILVTISVVRAATPKILLIPIDDRPATSQFAQMIGRVAGIEVETPPTNLLGRFIAPGESDRILAWLRGKDLSQYQSVVVSTEMISVGGLVASRTPNTPFDVAIRRLRELWAIRKANPQTHFYAFSTTQRIAPTALRNTRDWAQKLSNLVVFKSKLGPRITKDQVAYAASIRAQIPPGEVERYYAARLRNHRIQQELLRMTAQRAFDYLIIGQDDAQPFGPHVAETARLQAIAKNLDISKSVYFCEGIDQHSNVLLSRAMLQSANWSPRVRVVFADHMGRQKIAAYETQKVETSLADQLAASGARPAESLLDSDFTLYVNTPSPRPELFDQFVHDLQMDIDQGMPVAVADINLGTNGTGDARLFDALCSSGRAMNLLGYAGWNTAGNTLGTAIPAANMVLLSRRTGIDPLTRELNQRKFLLHRMVNDFEYHQFTRPKAYALQRELGVEKEETYGSAFDALNSFVRKDVSARLETTFKDLFQGRRFFAGNQQYEMKAINGIDVELPWPRAYEVRIGFDMQANLVRPPSF